MARKTLAGPKRAIRPAAGLQQWNIEPTYTRPRPLSGAAGQRAAPGGRRPRKNSRLIFVARNINRYIRVRKIAPADVCVCGTCCHTALLLQCGAGIAPTVNSRRSTHSQRALSSSHTPAGRVFQPPARFYVKPVLGLVTRLLPPGCINRREFFPVGTHSWPTLALNLRRVRTKINQHPN